MRRGTIGLLVLVVLAAAAAGATVRSTAQAQTKVT
jgi:hypothetical protein